MDVSTSRPSQPMDVSTYSHPVEVSTYSHPVEVSTHSHPIDVSAYTVTPQSVIPAHTVQRGREYKQWTLTTGAGEGSELRTRGDWPRPSVQDALQEEQTPQHL